MYITSHYVLHFNLYTTRKIIKYIHAIYHTINYAKHVTLCTTGFTLNHTPPNISHLKLLTAYQLIYLTSDYIPVNSFKYLGAMVNNDNSIEEEIKERIAAGNKAYHVHKKIIHIKPNLPKRQNTPI